MFFSLHSERPLYHFFKSNFHPFHNLLNSSLFPQVRRLTAVLACADHILRTLDGSTVTQSLELPSSPTTLCLMNGDGGTTGDHVLVGMEEGQIYLAQIR